VSNSEQIHHQSPFTLGIDIGGTNIKMLVMDAKGQAVTPYIHESTPTPATVEAICSVITHMIKTLNTHFDHVAAGFPGIVVFGIVKDAPHLDASWVGVNLEERLQAITGTPARVANDADVQGYGDEHGKGVELVMTLGTGVGSALFVDGRLVPNLEFGHHPFEDSQTYEQALSKVALDEEGVEQWKDKLKRAINLWLNTFNCQKLYIGGGLANLIDFKLPDSVEISQNIEGTLGGIKLWQV